MKNRKLCLLISFLLIVSATVWGADKKTKSKRAKKPAPVQQQDEILTIPLPKSHLDLQAQYFSQEKKSRSVFDVQASTWKPQLLKDEVYFDNQSQYQTHPISKFSAQYVGAPFLEWKSMAFKPILGFSFTQVTRTMDLIFHEHSSRIEENLNFYAIKLGIELSPQEKLWGFAEPLLRIHYLPMWTQAASTEINSGIDRTSTALEYSVGAGFSSAPVTRWLGFTDVSFQMGYEKTTGLSGVPYEGSGLIFGTRIQL